MKRSSTSERGDFKFEARGERVKTAKRKVLEILDTDYPVVRSRMN
jgi:hypothetical protein